MKSSLLFEFIVDKENKKIHVTREFAADLPLVWEAWTSPELLDQWWAPKPYRAETKSMDFREGGSWFYAMISPENEYIWCRADYKQIEPELRYSALDAFCDEQGNINTDFPRSLWTNVFTGGGDTTTVSVTVAYDRLEDLERYIEMGFREGLTMGLGNLDELLETLKKNS